MRGSCRAVTLLLVCWVALCAHAAPAPPPPGKQKPLTPQRFIEDNKENFSLIYAASTRVSYFGGFLAGLLGDFGTGDDRGATFIVPLDSGFVTASNRSVEDMKAEIESSTISALEFWLGQWIIPKTLRTPDDLISIKKVETISGEILTFRLSENGKGVVVGVEGEPQGTGVLLGPMPIPMGKVTAYVLGPMPST